MLRIFAVAAAILVVNAGLSANARAEVTISISCSSLGIEQQLCKSSSDAWAKATGNKVKLVSTPADANERLALYQTMLAAQAKDIDVFQIDVIWPAILAPHLMDLTAMLSEQDRSDHFKVLVDNNTVDGKLVAVPWFMDAGLLYYRKDLLEKYGKEVPKTWTELTDTAKAIMEGEKQAGKSGLQGYVWQGRAYEGLTCNALEWIASYGGGSIVNADGEVTIDNPQAAQALDMAKNWIGTISPKGVLSYSEEESRGVFQSGNAVFMRNWPYAWALANADDSPVKGKVGVAVLPHGEGPDARNASALGGQNLAVSSYSAHPEEAADLVRYLTSAQEQKRRALEGSFNPTLRSLYSDTELLTANPFYEDFLPIVESAVPRPSTVTGRRYNQVSSAFVRTVHGTLSGQRTASAVLVDLNKELERLSRGGKW
ncbi:ABC transporter substrate-binding protein [Dongia deserti]|uniref:ABC transporter substrate-binding protein n=1 Tax=Dongia deserti TaxID=2268030 RepID=UPI000E656795|nr:ABC transporter substrate-binding protein [Dongia deserti]